MSVIIYKATNIETGKSYIGLTSETLGVRSRKHIENANRNPKYYFHHALNKYGKDSFKWEIIGECDTREKAAQLEIEMIKEHDTFHTGYNGTTGGDFGYTLKRTKEHNAKIAAALTGVPHTKERKLANSQAQKGKTLSVEHREKIRKTSTGKKRGPYRKQPS